MTITYIFNLSLKNSIPYQHYFDILPPLKHWLFVNNTLAVCKSCNKYVFASVPEVCVIL